VRSLFIFPALDRAEAMRRLETSGVQTLLSIGASRPGAEELIWSETIDDLSAADFDATDLADLEQAAGFRPTWGLEIAISGRFPDWRQRDLRVMTLWLLADGGCATSIEVDEFRSADGWRAYWDSIGEPLK